MKITIEIEFQKTEVENEPGQITEVKVNGEVVDAEGNSNEIDQYWPVSVPDPGSCASAAVYLHRVAGGY